MSDFHEDDGARNATTLFGRFKRWFTQTDIKIVVYTPIFLALFLMMIWPIPWNLFFHHVPEEVYPFRHMGFASLIGGLSGIAGIIRKEYPWSYRVTLRGKDAVLLNALMTLFFFSIGLYLLLCPI